MNVEQLSELQQLRTWDGLPRLQAVLKAEFQKQEGERNFFRILPRAIRVEGVHSDVLFWLLNPDGWHGLGDRFVGRFINAVLPACGHHADAIEVERIEKEFSTGKGPIDLLIGIRAGARRFVVGIENKIDSGDSPDQLCRYAAGCMRSSVGQMLCCWHSWR